jgi:hypothetical protein
MPQGQDIAYFEGKARQCFRLADGCTDSGLAAKLREIGYDFVEEALKLGANPETMPPHWFRSLAD